MKDPAFLFYSSDFLTGVAFMTNEEVGIYIKLLCLQHQHGGMIPKCNFNAIALQNNVRAKFIETDEGFFNARLMEEMDKRAQKSQNLSKNAMIRWNKHKQDQCKCNAIASDLHMPIENENSSLSSHDSGENLESKEKDEACKKAIETLNSVCGRSFRPTPKNIGHVRARLNEKFTLEELAIVVEHKNAEWGPDPKMSQYLRPETIFGPKFESYLQSANKKDERFV